MLSMHNVIIRNQTFLNPSPTGLVPTSGLHHIEEIWVCASLDFHLHTNMMTMELIIKCDWFQIFLFPLHGWNRSGLDIWEWWMFLYVKVLFISSENLFVMKQYPPFKHSMTRMIWSTKSFSFRSHPVNFCIPSLP